MGLFRELRWFFKEQWWRYTCTVLVLCTVALIQTQIPRLVGQAIDQVLHPASTVSWFDLHSPLVQLGFMGITIYILRYIWRICLFGAAYRLGYVLRRKLYQQYLSLDQQFYQSHQTGDLIAHISNDIQAIEMSAGEGVLTLVDSLFMGLLVLYIMCSQYSVLLTLFALLPLPVMAFLVQRIGQQIHQAFGSAQSAFGALNNTIHEHMMGLRTIRLFAAETFAADQINGKAQLAADANMQVARSDARFEPVISVCIGLAYLFAIIGGSYYVYQHWMTLGQLTSFSLYLGQLIWPMFALAWLYNLLERGHAAYQRIQPVLTAQSALNIHDQEDPLPADLPLNTTPKQCLSIALHDTTHSARLHHLETRIQSGQFIGIVGPTGSGKTTLLLLLQRFFDPAIPQQLQLNDKPLASYPLASLRQQFAYIPQDPYLFSLSIADNIALGVDNVSQEQIEQAAKLAEIHSEIINLPDGYQTMVGERGITLSGGQKQRISIARAWLMQRPFLLLDDALSAVDAKTAARIIDHLFQDKHHQLTLIMVTHRLQELLTADNILVLKHGNLGEQGPHSDLISHSDYWYAKTWQYQQLQQKLGDFDA